MSFTDIFIKRPVLASVVSLLILLIGAQAGFKLPIRQYPELSNTTITVTTVYPGANADLIQGFITVPIQQAVASTEGIDTLVATSTQNVSTVTLNLKLDADPDRAMTDVLSKVAQVKGILPREADEFDRHQEDGRGVRADVPVVQFQGDERLADQRLSQPRGAAEAADHRRRRQCRDPGRPDLRHAHLARPRPHGGARRDAARCARRARQQQLHLGARPGEGRFRADQYRRQDLARQSGGLRPPRGAEPRRRAGPPDRRRRDRARAAKREFIVRVRRAEGGVHRRLRHADRQSAHGDHQCAQGRAGDPARAARGTRSDHRL